MITDEPSPRGLAWFDLSDVDHIALPAVAIQALACARIVHHVLGQALADHQTNQRLGAVVDGFMRRAAGGQADEIARADLVRFLADYFRAPARSKSDERPCSSTRLRRRATYPCVSRLHSGCEPDEHRPAQRFGQLIDTRAPPSGTFRSFQGFQS